MRLLIRIVALFWLLLVGIVFFTQASGSDAPVSGRFIHGLILVLYLILLVCGVGVLLLRNWARKFLATGLFLLFILNLVGTLSLIRGGLLLRPDELLIGTLNWFVASVGIHGAVPLFLPVGLLGISAVVLFLPSARAATSK